MSSFSRIGAKSAEKIPKTIVTSPVAEPNPDDVEPKKSFIDFFKAPKSPFTPAGSVFYTRANAFPMNPVLGYSNRELKADLDINIPGVHTPIAGKSMGDHNSAHIYIRYSDALTTTGADKETTDFVLKTWSDADLQVMIFCVFF